MSIIAEEQQATLFLNDVLEKMKVVEVKPKPTFVQKIVSTPPYIQGDIDNIRYSLPKLFGHQQEDVLKAENRFLEGKGFLFTNGTGTGKTFVGLGTAYRFYQQGKRNILIVVPTEAKSIDWIEDGEQIGLPITMLNGIADCGVNVVVTTYANFYQNEMLELREWDLIVYDESHYLLQNSKGDPTVYLAKHKKLANLPSAAKIKSRELVGDRPPYENTDLWKWRAESWKHQTNFHVHNFVDKTKVLFLSATPFAYHKSLHYADGCLWNILENIETPPPPPQGYNNGGPWEKFMMKSFGYTMKYNKLTTPDVEVDVSLMERQFFEHWKEEGVMSTRILELEQDYSREFIKLDSDLGEAIDKGIDIMRSHEFEKEYKWLSEIVSAKYNYLYVNQLLEAIKAKEILPRVKKHLALGRKVVLFHGYNHTVMEHPFKFNPYKLTGKDEKWMITDIKKDIERFELDYPELVNLNLDDLSNTRKTISDYFPDAVQINGTVPKKKRKINEVSFNSDYDDTYVIIVQSKAGREGISLHDKSGMFPRASINLSLPVTPPEAIQIEGRTYRSGLKSDSLYEYPTLHTNFEKRAFSEKIASRSKTVENLAMGELARDLETSFKEGFINANSDDPSLEQGKGGKEADRMINTASEFDKAKTYYFSRQKKNAKNKSFEGIDYYATPEPLGYKMVQWLNPLPGERGAEFSAGHGAISRWFPNYCSNTMIEPSADLYAEMKLVSSGKTINDIFDYYYTGNKYDFIAINPPYGKGGKTAMEHVAKSVKHMADRLENPLEHRGARMLAIVPQGNAMQRRFDDYIESKEFDNFRFTGEIILPTCLFKRAGTSVATKIIRIEHTNTGNTNFNHMDLSHCDTINDFLDTIEDLNF